MRGAWRWVALATVTGALACAGARRAGRQGRVLTEGNAYLDREYPLLDHLIRATVVTTTNRVWRDVH